MGIGRRANPFLRVKRIAATLFDEVFIVHGQKKRRKRTLEGSFALGETILDWRLTSEPLWSASHGYKGACISVQAQGEVGRELILLYPYPRDAYGSPMPLPQRPQISEKTIQEGVQLALEDGWDPHSRGKAIVLSCFR